MTQSTSVMVPRSRIRRHSPQWLWGMVVLALLILLPGTAALAGPVLDFGIVAPTNSSSACAAVVSWAGDAAPLVGTCIEVDNVVGLDTPANPGIQLICVGCFLNFTTGGFTGSDVDFASSLEFFGGGFITITGAIPALGISGTLLSGSFTVAHVIDLGGSFKISGAAFSDVKHATLAGFYGLPGGPLVPYAGAFNLLFIAPATLPSAFVSSTVVSGNVANTLQVPEPSTAVLLVSSFLVSLGVPALRRRRPVL